MRMSVYGFTISACYLLSLVLIKAVLVTCQASALSALPECTAFSSGRIIRHFNVSTLHPDRGTRNESTAATC